MESYTAQNVPVNVPVQMNDVIAQRVRNFLGVQGRYALVTKVFPDSSHPKFAGLVKLQVMRMGGKWTMPQDTWLPVNSEFLPIQEEQAKRILALREKFELNHLGSKFTVPTTNSGADPEIFVVDKKTKKIIPAFAFLPDKKKPINFYDSSDKGLNAFWDGFQAEFTTTAFGCLQEMCRTLQCGLNGVLNAAKVKFPDAMLSPDSVVEIDGDVLNSVADQHAALGCSRSMNAYGTPHVQVENPRMLPFRFAGGHMHFGQTAVAQASEEDIVEWVKILDALAGVASVLWFQGMENPIRRQFYGRAGEYRRPRHGLEYRTIGNAWLRHPALFHLMYGFARTSLMFARSGLGKHLNVVAENVRDVVDSYDVEGAKKIVRANKSIFKSMLNYQFKEKGVNVAMKALESGLGELMYTPDDLEKNWVFRTEWWEAANTISAGYKI